MKYNDMTTSELEIFSANNEEQTSFLMKQIIKLSDIDTRRASMVSKGLELESFMDVDVLISNIQEAKQDLKSQGANNIHLEIISDGSGIDQYLIRGQLTKTTDEYVARKKTISNLCEELQALARSNYEIYTILIERKSNTNISEILKAKMILEDAGYTIEK